MSKKIACPHDRMFRSAMVDIRVAREFLTRYLPASIVAHIDFESLRLCSTTYINSSLKLTESDVLYQANLAGQPAYFLMLCCEHQRTPHPLMPLRILEYDVGIWNNHVKQSQTSTLPLIYNLVFYNGPGPYPYTTDLREMFSAPKELVEAVFYQPFTLINIQEIPDDTLRQHQWSGVLSFFMKNIFARDFMPYLKEIMSVLHSIEQHQGGEYVTSLLNYALHAGQIEETREFVEIVTEGLSSTIGEKMMTGAQRLMEIGMQQGMQQGIEKGKQTLLRQMVEDEFGSIPSPYLEYIEAANEETILHLLKKLRAVKSLEEMFEC